VTPGTGRSVNPATTHLGAELRTQPQDWLRVSGRVAELADRLPAPGQRVAVVGCGTSYHMAMAYAVLREAAGRGLTDAFPASEHHLGRGYDRVLAISRSGTTTEVVELLRELRGHTPSTAIVATPGTPVTRLADQVVLLSEVDEQSVVQTRFATTTLALLRAHLGHDLAPAAQQAQALLDSPAAQVLGPLLQAEQVTFLGRGWTIGLALEAALKLRESAQLWTEQYPAMEYRHGPISIAAPGRAVWALGEVPEGLADQVRGTGAHFEHSDRDPMAELVRVHLLSEAAAGARGLDPDHPRGLSRAVVLDRVAPDAR